MADQQRLRQLKIKTGVLKRLGQERTMNIKEIAQQNKHIEKMKAEGRDEYDIKKQYEVLEECHMMVPNTQQRLEAAHKELSDLVASEADLAGCEEHKQAVEMLAQVSFELPQ